MTEGPTENKIGSSDEGNQLENPLTAQKSPSEEFSRSRPRTRLPHLDVMDEIKRWNNRFQVKENPGTRDIAKHAEMYRSFLSSSSKGSSGLPDKRSQENEVPSLSAKIARLEMKGSGSRISKVDEPLPNSPSFFPGENNFRGCPRGFRDDTVYVIKEVDEDMNEGNTV